MPQMHNTSVLQHLLSTASYDATSYISRVRRLSSFALPASRHPVSRLNLFTRFLKDVSDVSTARKSRLRTNVNAIHLSYKILYPIFVEWLASLLIIRLLCWL
ncbi:hypothetical protein Y032_0174g438 [Ancylostoma ceylanicum]|uniref:Uncharacterized protein n=1 Tax=Ancylostoma ceylanicum TaxID=53326 RepID=A0A016SUU5_9BILA|nr:hypothetical protein Y032_0174g438 [Ancylostoma ceylanicum]